MMPINFKKLNDGWNAEPNSPDPVVTYSDRLVQVKFYLNYMVYKCFVPEQTGVLTFTDCSRWRLGYPNDEGWYHRNQCRYGKIAPKWGEFYEISGDDELRTAPRDWAISLAQFDEKSLRHFLFYFRDNTFECLARDWSFVSDPPPPEDQS